MNAPVVFYPAKKLPCEAEKDALTHRRNTAPARGYHCEGELLRDEIHGLSESVAIGRATGMNLVITNVG